MLGTDTIHLIGYSLWDPLMRQKKADRNEVFQKNIKGRRQAWGPCGEAKTQHIFPAAAFFPSLSAFIIYEWNYWTFAEPINSYSWGQTNTDFLPCFSSSFSDMRTGKIPASLVKKYSVYFTLLCMRSKLSCCYLSLKHNLRQDLFIAYWWVKQALLIST